MDISLTPEIEPFIHDKVKSGRYLSASEVVREGLRLLKDFIVSNNQEAARIFISELTLKFQTLANFPEMGRFWNELFPPLRSFPVGRYLIFYRPVNKSKN